MITGTGQINMDTELGTAIYNIIKNNDDINNILEVGTWNGQGTTVCIMNGIIDKKNAKLYSIEANAGEVNRARIFWNDKDLDNKLNIIHGKLHMCEMPNLDYLYKNNFIRKGLELCHYNPEKKLLNDPNIPLLKLDNYFNKLDMVIIDGGEYTSEGDFDVVMKYNPIYIVLDDTRVYKCNKIRLNLLNDPNWKCIYDNQKNRHGESIFQKIDL